jgi:hypothetical protein
MDPALTVTGNPTGSGPVAAVAATSGTAVAADLRRSRVEMTKVDLWSTLKVSLCFYLAGLVITLLAGLVVWLLLDAAGQIHSFEKFMGDILSAKDYHLVASEILVGAVLIGLVVVALMTLITVIAAALYNVFADLVGGIEITLVEAD